MRSMGTPQGYSIDEEQSISVSPPGEEMSGETLASLENIEDDASDSLLLEEKEECGGSSHGEEEMEPTTDEDLRLWKYPPQPGTTGSRRPI